MSDMRDYHYRIVELERENAAQAARIKELETDKDVLAAMWDRADMRIAAQAARIKELESQDFYVRLSEENDRLHERIAALTAERDALKLDVSDYEAMVKDMFSNERSDA